VGGEQVRGIYIWDFMRPTLTPLTIDAANNRNMEWTRDGQRIIYTSNRGGADNLWWQFADGSGSPERLTTSPNVQMATGITPDGAAMIFFERMPGTLADLMQVALDGSHRVTPVLQTPANERNGIVSPSGRWIAYQSDRSGHDKIYVRPFPNVTDGEFLVSTNGGTRPMWAPDGKELYYVASAPGDPIMRVAVPPSGSTWQSVTPVKLFDGYAVTNPNRTYDVARDGRFLMMKASPEGQPPAPRLIVVQHWDEEVKARVPVH
jgi:serine/threonine-protein kinase